LSATQLLGVATSITAMRALDVVFPARRNLLASLMNHPELPAHGTDVKYYHLAKYAAGKQHSCRRVEPGSRASASRRKNESALSLSKWLFPLSGRFPRFPLDVALKRWTIVWDGLRALHPLARKRPLRNVQHHRIAGNPT
jgi:hypothetical protein